MNALNTLVRPGTSHSGGRRAGRGPAPAGQTAAAEATARAEGPAPRTGRGALVRDADGMAVASFVMGLVGLLVFNLVLGPCALVLAGLAVARGTTRRGRAALGLTLGVADLAVLAAVSAADQTFSWGITG